MNESALPFDSIAHYYEAKNNVLKLLEQAEDILYYDELSDEDKNLLYKMLKESMFEIKMFEFFLRKNPSISIEYLHTYYLAGHPIENKARYQTNLEIMLDDVYEVLGEQELIQIFKNISLNTRAFPPIKKAMMFVYDAESELELPLWYQQKQ